VNVYVEGVELAANIGQGTITSYGTLSASASALIKITAATGGGSATWAPMITLTDTVVPEPNSLYLLGTGLLALAGVVRRKLSRG